ncbi:hypothetical protein PO909_000752 [Leuciscus waleckii]
MTLPDAVLAFKLLDTACLEEKSRQLALTACTHLTFTSMKLALKRIFGGKTSGASGGSETQDAAFFTEQRPPDKFRWNSGPSQSRQRQPQQGTNPLDKYGMRTKCVICQSTYHWAKDCPHQRKHCTRTVCGEKWLDCYMKDLSHSQINKLLQTESSSCRPFRFGDGQVVHSNRKVKLPAKIGLTKCHIETEVVPVDIPLLLSKMSLKRAGTVLDMENDRVVMFKQPVPLELTSSGHYCVDIKDAEMSTKEKR